ncbi:hypothetical protein PLICRDRAFT_181138 [Plicaturopsis crispa FD-325 SS-3]|uniref:Uncharacterized protein n=1 Tax=Plicaturopsis crispa FD-325 SS-3 TaxID=944288 RepID=A0A0C9T0S2_PLICR|nr:hypothetical protein PLICRDRAFT_181138 [Plicaturopsis crispa FD-325 SS-3]
MRSARPYLRNIAASHLTSSRSRLVPAVDKVSHAIGMQCTLLCGPECTLLRAPESRASLCSERCDTLNTYTVCIVSDFDSDAFVPDLRFTLSLCLFVHPRPPYSADVSLSMSRSATPPTHQAILPTHQAILPTHQAITPLHTRLSSRRIRQCRLRPKGSQRRPKGYH